MEIDGDLAVRLVDAAPVGILVVDGIGTITFASPTVEELTGYDAGNVVGTSILDHLVEEAVSGLLESVSYVTEHTATVMGPVNLGFRHADGRLRILEAYATNRYDDPDISGLVVAVRDQTCQYRVAEALTAYTERGTVTEALTLLTDALLGLPIRGHGAFLDPAGRALAATALPEEMFAPEHWAGSPWATTVATGQPSRPATLPEVPEPFRSIAAVAGLRTVWAEPVQSPSGSGDGPTVLACLLVGRHEEGPPSVNETITLASVARNAALLMERDRLLARLGSMARHDPLTGVANRAHLLRDRPCPDAVLYLDLDGFKPVNDSLGHAAGDAVLVEVARRLAAACRETDELGRIGGDEFLVLCNGVENETEAAAIADRLLAAVVPPIAVDGAEVSVGASVGVAWHQPPTRSDGTEGTGAATAPGPTLDHLIARADAALYEAKRAGRGGAVVAGP